VLHHRAPLNFLDLAIPQAQIPTSLTPYVITVRVLAANPAKMMLVIASFLFVFKIKLAFALKTPTIPVTRVPGNVSRSIHYRAVSRKTQTVLHHRAPLKYLISEP
jgi:hypothetical protein